VTYGLLAYLWWGLVPIYFKAVSSVPAVEVLAHRVVWCLLLLLGWTFVTGRAAGLRALVVDRRTVLGVIGTTTLIATNWFLFIWAVFTDQVLQASLGYFINPLLNVLLGMIVLGERLRRLQWLAVGLAAAGVLVMTISRGAPPFLALGLAGSFGFYGLLRKRSRIEPTAGLIGETAILLPIALGYLAWRASSGELVFAAVSLRMDLLLIAGGAVTGLPLVWFVNAAQRLRYVTIGFMQYLAPSLQLLLAVVAFGEPFPPATRAAFTLIWAGLAIFSLDSIRALRRRPA
jgi:chloramphenicol-sensitive protein RarD